MLEELSVFVIGQGFVGGSLARGLQCENLKVFAYDPFKECEVNKDENIIYLDKTSNGETPLTLQKSIDYVYNHPEYGENFSNVFFVCLPTPMKKSGEADISLIENTILELDKYAEAGSIAVIKSTIPPGSTLYLNSLCKNIKVIFNPEFLTEANALNDFLNQDRIVLGGDEKSTAHVKNVYQYNTRFEHVNFALVTSTEAELCKYVINCFLATKVSFANEIYDIVNALNCGSDASPIVNYDNVIDCVKLDPRVGQSHWSVPGPVLVDGKPVRGYGGHCFPKDINALLYLAKSLSVSTPVLAGAEETNLNVRPEEHRDWLKQIGRAVSAE